MALRYITPNALNFLHVLPQEVFADLFPRQTGAPPDLKDLFIAASLFRSAKQPGPFPPTA
jgi:hypothetical protein